jgi:hypothetical protein
MICGPAWLTCALGPDLGHARGVLIGAVWCEEGREHQEAAAVARCRGRGSAVVRVALLTFLCRSGAS